MHSLYGNCTHKKKLTQSEDNRNDYPLNNCRCDGHFCDYPMATEWLKRERK